MAEPNQGQRAAHHPQDTRRSDDAENSTITIYSDPGRSSLWMRRLLKGGDLDWSRGATMIHHQRLIPLRPDQTLDLTAAQRWAGEDQADLTIIVTEIPRMSGSQPKLAELHFADKLAIISLPALGPVNIRRSLQRELRRCVDALLYDSVSEAQRKGGRTSSVEDQQGFHTYYTTPRGILPSRTWTTLGMVAANEPFWGLTKLSGVFAAAAATGAFGVFYSTIWEMATFLPVWRLAIVSLAAIAVVVLWLIFANRLWDRLASVKRKHVALMYNVSTILSLLVSVAGLYVLLFCAIVLMSVLLIDPQFMTETIGEEADFANYLQVAWLSASLGTVAGAVGSNFDSRADLKTLTQGTRELQRYPRDAEQS